MVLNVKGYEKFHGSFAEGQLRVILMDVIDEDSTQYFRVFLEIVVREENFNSQFWRA